MPTISLDEEQLKTVFKTAMIDFFEEKREFQQALFEDILKELGSTTDLFVTKLDSLQEQLNTLQTEFQSKLKYDQHKEQIIDKLHNQLQEYKNDLLKKLQQPMMMDIIHAIDDFKKLTRHYQQQAPTEIDPLKLIKLMETIPDDLEHLLYRQGVDLFNASQETQFDPSRQRVLKSLPTSDPGKNKTIAQSLHNGYEWQGKVLRPEMVEVYIYKANSVAEETKQNDR